MGEHIHSESSGPTRSRSWTRARQSLQWSAASSSSSSQGLVSKRAQQGADQNPRLSPQRGKHVLAAGRVSAGQLRANDLNGHTVTPAYFSTAYFSKQVQYVVSCVHVGMYLYNPLHYESSTFHRGLRNTKKYKEKKFTKVPSLKHNH